MDQVLAYLNSLLAIKPRQGFLLLLLGATIVFLKRSMVWPFDGIPDGYVTIAGVISVAGALVLLIAMCSWIVDRRAAGKQKATELKLAQEADEELDRQADQNVAILSAFEMGNLLWIIQAGNQRFQGHLNEGALRSLYQKGIVEMPTPLKDRTVFEVRDNIWRRRNEIMDSHPRIPIPNRSPFLRW